MDLGVPGPTAAAVAPAVAPTAAAPAAAVTQGQNIFDRITAFFSHTLAALVANNLLLGIVLTVLLIAATLLLLVAVRRLSASLSRALRARALSGELRFRTVKIASGEQLREALLSAIGYLRLLLFTALVAVAFYLLSLILIPAAAGQIFAVLRGLWLSLVTVLAWFIGLRAFRQVGSSILAAVASRSAGIRPLTFKSFTVLSAPMIKRALLLGIRVVGWGLLAFSAALLIALTLGFFSFTWSWSKAILSVFSGLISPILSAIVGYLPKLLFAVIIIVIARIVLRLLKAFFTEVEAGRLGLSRFDRDWARTTYKLLRLVVIVFAFIMVFPYIPGSGSEAFRSVAIFLGVLISLGSSSFVGNMMAGIALTYMSPFRLGDRVKIGDTMGDVVERTLLITRIRTIKNVIVTVPNAIVLSREVENYSARPAAPLILHTAVTIGYDVHWQAVHAALLAAASGIDAVLADPKPFVLQTALNDYSVEYELNVSTDRPAIMAQTYSELHRAIQDSFAQAGIEILTPAYNALRDGSGSTIPDAQGGHGEGKSQ